METFTTLFVNWIKQDPRIAKRLRKQFLNSPICHSCIHPENNVMRHFGPHEDRKCQAAISCVHDYPLRRQCTVKSGLVGYMVYSQEISTRMIHKCMCYLCDRAAALGPLALGAHDQARAWYSTG